MMLLLSNCYDTVRCDFSSPRDWPNTGDLWLMQNAISFLLSLTSWVVLSDFSPAVDYINVMMLFYVPVVNAVQEREM